MIDAETDLEPLLARAGILMFEYDADAFLVTAMGSCLGGPAPDVEVRSGIMTPDSVRRALSGELVVDWREVAERTIAVHHQPVRGDRGLVERVLVTAFDVTGMASGVKPLHVTERPA